MHAILQLDGNILLWIQEYVRHDSMNGFWTFITSLGNAGLFWIALSMILLIFPATRKAGALALLSMMLCFLITNLWLKPLIARPRPYTRVPGLEILIPRPSDWSFPSGHSTASFAAACSYFHAAPKKRSAIPALILAAMIAFSRLYVGVHYPTDVLGGILVGCLGSYIIWKIYLHRSE